MFFNYSRIGSRDSIDGEHDNHSPSAPKQDTVWLLVCTWVRWVCVFTLLFSILAVQICILHYSPLSRTMGSEINGLVPEFRTHQRKYLIDDRFNSDHKTVASMNETKEYWLDLLPSGGGFVHIDDPESYILPPPIHFPRIPGKNVYAVAVFHQLHCLWHIALSFDKLVLQIRERNFTIDEYTLVHNNHCFDYLREAVMCAADTTLEGQAQGHGGDKVPGTDGTGGVHVCKDYDAVVAWMQTRALYDGVHL